MRIDGKRARRTDAQRVSVRRRARQCNEARRAAAAGPVLHHDGLAEGFAELFADKSRDFIG